MKVRATGWFQPSVLLISALITAGVGGLYWSTVKERDLYFFEIDITSQNPGLVQLFYDMGRGLVQEDSATQSLFTGPSPVHYSFQLPRGQLRGLRFDPTTLPGTVVLARPTIIDVRRREIRIFSQKDFTPIKGIEFTEIGHDSITVGCTADDPSLTVELGEPLNLGRHLSDTISEIIPLCLGVFGACWLAAGIVQKVPRRLFRSGRDFAQQRPLATIAGVSLVAILIQCHPVVFFGKSFVSPDNGTFFLYDHIPTLPGYIPDGQEDTGQSDVAALLHGSVWYPSLQRQALFRDHELPLWNRYSLGGLPLLGQGQSMFGSLLNFITIFGDSSSGSWDLRFFLSRWLYGWGLGLATWLLVRHLGVACVISLIGPFIGFFVFRLNHMAQLSLDLSPWILVGWAMLKDRPSVRGSLMLFIANWEVMNSGTVKEAYMLILCLNVAGVLLIGISDLSLREKLSRLGAACLAGVCFILISAPIWMVFLNSLVTGATHYDRASVSQVFPWQILGLFDEMFYRRFSPVESHTLPAANFAIFIGMVWVVVAARETWKDKACVALCLAFLLPAFLVFGIVPSRALLSIPFINNIYHIHNTFSGPLVILSSVLAGFGFKAMGLAATYAAADWRAKCAEFTGLCLLLFLIYFGSSLEYQGSLFFRALVASLCLAAFSAHLGLRSWARTRHWGVLVLSIGGAAFFTGWQSCQFVKSPADRYVYNPGKRIDFRAHSEAVEQINLLLGQERFRCVGLGYNVFTGFSELLRWETIYGVDPIRNNDFDLFCNAADMTKKDWGDSTTWHEDNLPLILPFQNLLNVRYYLASHSATPAEIKGLRWIASHDLDLYESTEVWPRAFFTDRYSLYTEPSELISILREAPKSRPLATLQTTGRLPDFPPSPPADLSTSLFSSARQFRFTTNVTTFTVDAPQAGLAVLAENYLKDDFRASLNGKRVPYYKVNQTCKGVVIPGPGTYEVRFEYWPRRFTLALEMMSIGLLAAAVVISVRLFLILKNRRLTATGSGGDLILSPSVPLS